MKKTHQFPSSLALVSVAYSPMIGQGALMPPGPPAPTMKSLDQIERRTPISYSGFYINSPGTYYVTTNLTGYSAGYGIEIAGDNVTIDLNGFALFGVSGSYSGVYIYGSHTNITIRKTAS